MTGVSSRPIKGLTLSQIAELPACEVSLRELVAIVTAEAVEPVNTGALERHHQAPRRYSLVDVSRAIRRYHRADA